MELLSLSCTTADVGFTNTMPTITDNLGSARLPRQIDGFPPVTIEDAHMAVRIANAMSDSREQIKTTRTGTLRSQPDLYVFYGTSELPRQDERAIEEILGYLASRHTE